MINESVAHEWRWQRCSWLKHAYSMLVGDSRVIYPASVVPLDLREPCNGYGPPKDDTLKRFFEEALASEGLSYGG